MTQSKRQKNVKHSLISIIFLLNILNFYDSINKYITFTLLLQLVLTQSKRQKNVKRSLISIIFYSIF